jgi:hypothetical protein
MTLRLTDAPLDSAQAVNVTIEEIVLIRSDDEDDVDDSDDGASEDEDDAGDDSESGGDDEPNRIPVYRPDVPQTINLLDYREQTLTLAEDAEVPVGTYEQMRLVLTNDNEIVFEDGTTARLQTPSAQESGYKILLPEVTVANAGDTIRLTLDFDASQSIVVRGNGTYLLRPTIRPAEVRFNGEDLDEANAMASGALTNVNTSGPTLTVEGVTFRATPSTEYEGVSALGGLSSFSYASVEARENDDGTFTAVEVEGVADEDRTFVLEGTLDAVGTSSLTLLGVDVQVTEATSFEDEETSLAVLAAGSRVEAEFTKDASGTRIATNIEVEDDEIEDDE